MAKYRFDVGTDVMCNLGPRGWQLGRIVAHDYHETTWPEDQIVPYQVLLEDNFALIYVPLDDDRFCREATNEDIGILKRRDALAELNSEKSQADQSTSNTVRKGNLSCDDKDIETRYQQYRKGRCFCCNDCPRNWLHAELYSEYYRCASRNNLKISRHEINLGKISVGDELIQSPDDFLSNKTGFLQAPTLVRLPPGIIFSDQGYLSGRVRYDPHSELNYDVNFVAVSTADWSDHSVGIVRLEIKFEVEGNDPPAEFDTRAFLKKQSKAHSEAVELMRKLNQTWDQMESGELSYRAVCDRMLADLNRLRTLLEANPRLDNGRWWAHLGGFHMNVHKLLENALFECELYLGYALTFDNDEIKNYAEQNLKGCYQKRQLEAARFMWYDGIQLMLQSKWAEAIEIFKEAALKKEGWGWAVNYGDIWLSEAVATMMQGVRSSRSSIGPQSSTNIDLDGIEWIGTAGKLIEKSLVRVKESGAFGDGGHPWGSEIDTALKSYKNLISQGEDTAAWLEHFQSRTIFWCSQVLAGVSPFPPKCRERLAEESTLIAKLAVYNE